MTLILDTAPLLGLADAADPRFRAILRCLERERGDLIIPSPITAEVDHFLFERFGRLPQERFFNDIANGVYRVECLSPEDHREVLRLARQYRDLDPGLADLSVVVLAARFNTTRILTFDERHFRVMRPLQGGAFTLRPLDEDVTEAVQR